MDAAVARKVASTNTDGSTELRKRDELASASTWRDLAYVDADVGECKPLTYSHQSAPKEEKPKLRRGAFKNTADGAQKCSHDHDA